MLKRSLVAVAVVALLAMSAQAGEIKIHNWPCVFVDQEIASIPVLMDIGYYMKIKDQDKLKIKLVQDTLDLHKFHGCVNMTVECNFNAILTCKVNPNGVVGGDYTCTFPAGGSVLAPGGVVEVCVDLVNAVLAKATSGPKKDVQVATLKILVRPA